MATFTVNIPEKNISYVNKQEFENLLGEFFLEYIETKQDLQLINDLKEDNEFNILNAKLEEKLCNL